MVTVTDVKICFLDKKLTYNTVCQNETKCDLIHKMKNYYNFFHLECKEKLFQWWCMTTFFLLLWLSLFRYNYTVTPDILQSSSWPFKVSPPFPQDGWLFIKRIFFYFQKSKLKRFSPINNISWRVEHRFQFLYLQ